MQNTTFGGIQGFTVKPSTPWQNDAGTFAGIIRQERNWTYVLFDRAGHLVPAKQPGSVSRLRLSMIPVDFGSRPSLSFVNLFSGVTPPVSLHKLRVASRSLVESILLWRKMYYLAETRSSTVLERHNPLTWPHQLRELHGDHSFAQRQRPPVQRQV